MVRIIDKSNTVNDQVASGYMNQGLLIPGICLVRSTSRIVNSSLSCQSKTCLSLEVILVSELYRGARSYIYRLVLSECEFLSGDCAQVHVSFYGYRSYGIIGKCAFETFYRIDFHRYAHLSAVLDYFESTVGGRVVADLDGRVPVCDECPAAEIIPCGRVIVFKCSAVNCDSAWTAVLEIQGRIKVRIITRLRSLVAESTSVYLHLAAIGCVDTGVIVVSRAITSDSIITTFNYNLRITSVSPQRHMLETGAAVDFARTLGVLQRQSTVIHP